MDQDAVLQTGFAISEYHNAQEVYRQLRQLTGQAVRSLKASALDE
jgi:hypothetical protein